MEFMRGEERRKLLYQHNFNLRLRIYKSQAQAAPDFRIGGANGGEHQKIGANQQIRGGWGHAPRKFVLDGAKCYKQGHFFFFIVRPLGGHGPPGPSPPWNRLCNLKLLPPSHKSGSRSAFDSKSLLDHHHACPPDLDELPNYVNLLVLPYLHHEFDEICLILAGSASYQI